MATKQFHIEIMLVIIAVSLALIIYTIEKGIVTYMGGRN